jgi:hypothetical protein
MGSILGGKGVYTLEIAPSRVGLGAALLVPKRRFMVVQCRAQRGARAEGTG